MSRLSSSVEVESDLFFLAALPFLFASIFDAGFHDFPVLVLLHTSFFMADSLLQRGLFYNTPAHVLLCILVFPFCGGCIVVRFDFDATVAQIGGDSERDPSLIA